MDPNLPLRLVLAALAVWRVTHLLAEEDGPWGVVVRLRELAGKGILGELMDCFHCLSLWIAAPAAVWLTADNRERPLIWLALSGAACLLQRLGPAPLELHALPDPENTP